MNHKTSERHSSFTPMTSGNSKAWQPSVGIQNVERTRCIREDTHDPVSKGQHIWEAQMPGKLQAQNNSTASIRIFAHYDAVQERVQALIEVVDVTRRLVARHQKKQVGSALLIQGVPLKVELGEFGQRNKVRS
jgi:hypothetical protein